MYKRILVATDGSTLSKKAVKAAVHLAATMGAELVALNVVPTYPTAYFDGAITFSPSEIGQVEKLWAERGLAIAEEAGRAAGKAGVQCRPVTVHSDLVAEAILRAARKYRCDLVVMASHGRKGLKRLLLGSETQHVLTHGQVPVLVLR